FKADDKLYIIYCFSNKDKTYLSIDGENYILEKDKTSKAKTGKQQKGNSVFSPMPGLLVEVPVSVGDEVKSGETLAIVEAMKMENEIKSTIEGYVKKILAAPGDLVDSENPIIELATKD
ncbi:MAG: acetyl-CoA carboxylase biotin carboxyl carrier protein subunit, partial [Candidatus Aminicenantes bacterium]|nr:acetyl-CoA carboxylase biotin carboxyl carrier protein subunit [Candidatus Aminicenantes bacterium]